MHTHSCVAHTLTDVYDGAQPLKHRGRRRLHKQVGSDTCTRLRTMRIISLHPPPLACSGLSDRLSSSALFPPCYCIVTNGTNKTVCVGEQQRFELKCHSAVYNLCHWQSECRAIYIESTYTGVAISNIELNASSVLSDILNGRPSPFTSKVQCQCECSKAELPAAALLKTISWLSLM